MSKLEDEIRELRERTEYNRRQFLFAELQTCVIAIERAHLELSFGDTDEAWREHAMVSHGIAVIEHTLTQTTRPLNEVREKLAALKDSVEALRSELTGFPDRIRLSGGGG
jgi:hypothetical protein